MRLVFPNSLDSIVTDVYELHDKPPHPPLQTLFPLTKKFCDDSNYSYETFSLLVKSKLKIPWRHCTSIQAMRDVKSPPPIHHFTDLLSNSSHPISQDQYNTFTLVWTTLNVPDLLHLVHIYGLLDTGSLFWSTRV